MKEDRENRKETDGKQNKKINKNNKPVEAEQAEQTNLKFFLDGQLFGLQKPSFKLNFKNKQLQNKSGKQTIRAL